MSRLIRTFVVSQRPKAEHVFEIHRLLIREIFRKEAIISSETDLVWSTECTAVNMDDCIGVVRAMRKSKDMSLAIPTGVNDEQAARCVFREVCLSKPRGVFEQATRCVFLFVKALACSI